MSDEMTTEQIEAIKARKLIAQIHITDLCQGARWRMSIPVRDTDSDVVMQATLNDMSALLAAYEWLRNEFVSACEELEAEQHDNERLRARVAELEAPRQIPAIDPSAVDQETLDQIGRQVADLHRSWKSQGYTLGGLMPFDNRPVTSDGTLSQRTPTVNMDAGQEGD